MLKEQVINSLLNEGIIAVVRTDAGEKAINIAEALKEGGITAIEITMTVPNAVEVLAELTRKYDNNDMLIGAGTILDAESARSALLAGAKYLISPHLNPDVIRMCHRYRTLSIPGAMTVTEIVNAMEMGADFIKLFPASFMPPSFVKAVRAPLPYAKLIPTGGVSLDNVEAWFECGCSAVAVGGELTKAATQGDYDGVAETARQFVKKVNAAKSSLQIRG